MSKRPVWVAAIVIAAGILYLIGYNSVQPVGTDSGQIRGAIVDAVDALKHGRAGDAMRVVSPEYKDSTGLNYTRLRLLARQAAVNREMWTATVQSVNPMVTGNTARVSVTVAIGHPQGGGATTDTIQLQMRKDPVYAWLIFPTERWRVTSADHLPSDLSILGD
jgi:hypothetical protein